MAASLQEIVHFGRYEPLFRIAAGGMAEVYAARLVGEAGFQKLVAVKRMHPHLATDSGFVDMFLNEARLAAHVASPHVVQTLDLGRGDDGALYIVMELVVGLSLARLMELSGEPLPPPILVELIAQAAQGIDDAHEARTPSGESLGLIHRDISPHNILIGLDGRAKVTDFGIARAVNAPREETNIKQLKGKFAYMSPEQTRLEEIDRRSDVFSLGIVLWEALAGRRLFAHREPLSSIRLVRRAPIAKLHEVRAGLPRSVSAVVAQALERDLGRRTASAGELARALRRAGRDAFGELPEPAEAKEMLRSRGGEELARLERLIALGTSGADSAALEAESPRGTQVIGDHASGVAPLGTRSRKPGRLEDEPPKIPTVILDLDDEGTPLPEPETAIIEAPAPLREIDTAKNDPDHVRIGEDGEEPPTLLESRSPFHDPTPSEAPTLPPHRAGDDDDMQPTRRVQPIRTETPTERIPRRDRMMLAWVIGGACVIALGLLGGAALAWWWLVPGPSSSETAASNAPPSIARDEPANPTEPSDTGESVPPLGREESSAHPPAEPEAPTLESDVAAEEALAGLEGEEGAEPDPAAPEIADSEVEPEATAEPPASRPRRARPTGRPPQRASPPRTEPSPRPIRRPALMGVDDFDRRSR